MKTTTKNRDPVENSNNECCALCKLDEDSPDKYGEKITSKKDKITVHYFCLLMASGIYQRGEENEGICGFLLDDIKREIRRSARLTCHCCKKKGASIGCYVRSCRKTVHFPCGKQQQFNFQFTGEFPSYCKQHSPKQSASCDASLPQSCSVCLEHLEPVLSFSVLKCPSCLNSWFHRDCVQRQAHSAGMFFFKCTLCNNKEQFQEEMLRMGIYIPERDASWELEENAFGELLQVYQHCDAVKCISDSGRSSSSKKGWFELLRCKLCGSRGTHRKCSSLELHCSTWVCDDCSATVDGTASLPSPRRLDAQESGEQRRGSKRHTPSLHPALVCKRPSLSGSTPAEMLQALASQLLQQPPSSPSPSPSTRSIRRTNPKPIRRSIPSPSPAPVPIEVLVSRDQVLRAALELVKSSQFSPDKPLCVRFTGIQRTLSPRKPDAGDTRCFLRLLVRHIKRLTLFEGPEGVKNLSLDSQALREDLYYDVGCLLSLSLVHGGPPLGFFSKALYQCLFNYPRDSPLSLDDMGDTRFARKVREIEGSRTVEELREAMQAAAEYLEVAGCMRAVSSLADKQALLEDVVSFHLITRMQLPFQRFREGLKTLGVFQQVQMFPEVFFKVFCGPSEKLNADTVFSLFTVVFSDNQNLSRKETVVVTFWRHFLLECEEGRCASSLEDVLVFSTAAEEVPAAGFHPTPSVAFLHPLEPAGAFPTSTPSANCLYLPVVPTYETFKKHMEYSICQLAIMQIM
ncbi:G2/M phase-specific E3 ubiquitin-protein ligase isoform X1 [Hypomesus transpacificus]|uniref:G2/M phase-specific E3 ubiquitin-protein ligase isoform X1 n=1 Tax=Hypomesus transpacificus TaxID=137520 RepID=UPI001F07848C|nr:G2/M phase-specific E3 ubiquitin-protein ligase isoform X1 [Hypomesus transpacificus]XP_046874291.1 G2/M phase-specific E3 ubiquitin-protein ligase isoform X1 [Hypomesus transpacificus]XP_046874292.1 G2/M phase-specific E3 ubiquitin-protein ligase isoform X1 [Hypomesus transpacificus]